MSTGMKTGVSMVIGVNMEMERISYANYILRRFFIQVVSRRGQPKQASGIAK